jgi:hypothetical protein
MTMSVRGRTWLLPVGLLAAMVWSVAVSVSMPSWFDPSEDCALTAGRDGHGASGSAGIDIETSWFPPRARCDFGSGEPYHFISPTRSAVLTVLGVVVALAVAAGLVLAVRSLFEPARVIRAAEAVDLRRRRIAHLFTAAFVGAVTVGAFLVALVIAVFLAGPPGVITMLIALLTGLSAVATAIDRAHGPLPSTPIQSRRRGTVAAVVTLLVIAAAGARSLPTPGIWLAAVGATAYVLVVAVQWVRPRRSSLPLPEHSPAVADRSAGHR